MEIVRKSCFSFRISFNPPRLLSTMVLKIGDDNKDCLEVLNWKTIPLSVKFTSYKRHYFNIVLTL